MKENTVEKNQTSLNQTGGSDANNTPNPEDALEPRPPIQATSPAVSPKIKTRLKKDDVFTHSLSASKEVVFQKKKDESYKRGSATSAVEPDEDPMFHEPRSEE